MFGASNPLIREAIIREQTSIENAVYFDTDLPYLHDAPEKEQELDNLELGYQDFLLDEELD